MKEPLIATVLASAFLGACIGAAMRATGTYYFVALVGSLAFAFLMMGVGYHLASTKVGAHAWLAKK
jgi:hypothetical protein